MAPRTSAANCSGYDIHLIRLRRICEITARDVVHYVFLWGTPGKDKSTNMFDYLIKKNVSVSHFKKALSQDQIPHIEKDASGDSYDICLLFKCIQWGNDLVADRSDVSWRQEGGLGLESLLTTVKKKRNMLMHQYCRFDSQEFFEETEEYRRILEHILHDAGNRYGVPLGTVKKAVDAANLSINIIRDNPLIPKNLVEYKKQALFREKAEFMKKKSPDYLQCLYKELSYVTPVSVMRNARFQAHTIFTEMVLKDELSSCGRSVRYDNILAAVRHSVDDPVILIEGSAGSGKTTLTKKMLCDWISPWSSMKNLGSYDMLLYAEGRNSRVKSFKELLQSLIPDICKIFQGDDMVHVALDLKLLIIIDGLDEMNVASFELFKELIDLKTKFGITLIVTTRQERIQTYFNLVCSHQIKTKHIQIIGIPSSKRNSFVTKYFNEMTRNNLCGDLKGLLLYLKVNETRLDALWRLPYNLTLLIILWIKAPSKVNNITTSPELYWHIQKLLTERLLVRLHNNSQTQLLSESLLRQKVYDFISCLSKEALISLKNDDINISEESCKRLRSFCLRVGLPEDEMISAYLVDVRIRTATGWEIKQSFPHKGYQEFLGAYRLWLNLAKQNDAIEVRRIVEEIEQLLEVNNISGDKNRDIAQYVSNTLSGSLSPGSTVTRDFLTSMHKNQPLILSKYQNVFCILIGLIYIEGGSIGEKPKIEVLKLLEEAGITGRSSWLDILNSVNCDNTVLSYISKIPSLMEDTVIVTNATVFAYASLLNVTKASKVHFDLHNLKLIPRLRELFDIVVNLRVKVVNLSVTDDNAEEYAYGLNDAVIESVSIKICQSPTSIPYFKEFLENIVTCKAKVTTLHIPLYFRYLSIDGPVRMVWSSLLKRCQVEYYQGAVTCGMSFSPYTKVLCVSIRDEADYLHLLQCIPSLPMLEKLDLCISASCILNTFYPLPCLKYASTLFVADMHTHLELDFALGSIRQLCPASGSRYLENLCFPRSRLTFDMTEKLIQGLEGYRVRLKRNIYLPVQCRPKPNKVGLLHDMCKKKLGGEKIVWWVFTELLLINMKVMKMIRKDCLPSH